MIKTHVETDPKYDPVNNEVIENGVTRLFKSKHINEANLSFIFSDDNLLNSLKRKFFKLDHFTDVIAFRLNEYEEKNVDGEIYISIPRAKENAIKFEESFNRELARLIIHGCLHLLNFNDETDQEKEEMRKQEDHYLDIIKWNNIYG